MTPPSLLGFLNFQRRFHFYGGNSVSRGARPPGWYAEGWAGALRARVGDGHPSVAHHHELSARTSIDAECGHCAPFLSGADDGAGLPCEAEVSASPNRGRLPGPFSGGDRATMGAAGGHGAGGAGGAGKDSPRIRGHGGGDNGALSRPEQSEKARGHDRQPVAKPMMASPTGKEPLVERPLQQQRAPARSEEADAGARAADA